METFQENLEHFNEFLKFAEINESGIVTNFGEILVENPSDIGKWQPTIMSGAVDFNAHIFRGFRYKLESQPEYVPFEKWEEVFENAYNPEVIWVKSKATSINRLVTATDPDIYREPILIGDSWFEFGVCFENFVFFNPKTKETKPFGKLKNGN